VNVFTYLSVPLSQGVIGLTEKLEEKIIAAFQEELGSLVLTKLKAEDEETRKKFFEWFMYEFGLDVLFPFVGVKALSDDAKEWDRVRGSKKALRMALEWIGHKDSEVETFGPTANFYRYQIELKGDKTQDTEEIEKIRDIAGISSAHRDELFRIYKKEFDIKNLKLGERRLGSSMLSDYSGIVDGIDGIKLALKKEQICR